MSPSLNKSAALLGSDRMTGPGEHLTWSEMACWNRLVQPRVLIARYPDEWRQTRAIRLAYAFEVIRWACQQMPGRSTLAPSSHAISVRSAYRTEGYQAQLKAAGYATAVKSQHLQGRALDLAPPAGMPTAQFYEVIHNLATTTIEEIAGIGEYSTFVHVDTRPNRARLATWHRTTQDAQRAA